ncbi:MAG: rhodanese [Planctomycetaceae bacterium]|nr:rhodanese [Planctomycetaceae bacterium]
MEVDCVAVKARMDAGDEFLFLDCREQREFDHVRIEGTVLVPMNELPQRAAELGAWKDKDIIVHCHHGMRSLRVAEWLRNNGFPAAFSMAGGIDEWALTIDPSLRRY